MNRNRLFPAQNAADAHTCSSQARGLRRAGLFVAMIAAGVLFCSVPAWAQGLPPGDQVYLNNGTNVTSSVFYVGDQAYLYPSDPIEITVNIVEGHVYDQYGNLIGYITDASN